MTGDADAIAAAGTIDVERARAIARVEAALEAHTRAWAERGVAPPAPPILVDPAIRRALARGGADPAARPYLAACRQAAIEADPAVARARAAAPSWPGLVALTAARAAAAAPDRLLDVLTETQLDAPIDARLDLRGAGAPPAVAPPVPDAPVGLRDDIGLPAIEAARLRAIAAAMAAHHGVDARGLRVDVGDDARTFVIVPGRELRVVVRGGVAAIRWMEAMHELGHALLGLRAGPRPTRAIDEGVAAWCARAIERPAFLVDVVGATAAAAARAAVIARAGRARQVAQRAHLARFEAALLAGQRPPPPVPGRALERPPAPLWLDPGAQLVYAAADAIADRLDGALGAAWPTARLPAEIAAALA